MSAWMPFGSVVCAAHSASAVAGARRTSPSAPTRAARSCPRSEGGCERVSSGSPEWRRRSGRSRFRVRWRGGELDRLLDEGHASLVDRWPRGSSTSAGLSRRGHVLGLRRARFHRSARVPSGCLLVVEVDVVPDFQAMVAGLDRKARSRPSLPLARGWNASDRTAARDRGDSTSRDRLARLGAAVAAACPSRGSADSRTACPPERARSLACCSSGPHARAPCARRWPDASGCVEPKTIRESQAMAARINPASRSAGGARDLRPDIPSRAVGGPATARTRR